jgi:hypothetical protein
LRSRRNRRARILSRSKTMVSPCYARPNQLGCEREPRDRLRAPLEALVNFTGKYALCRVEPLRGVKNPLRDGWVSRAKTATDSAGPLTPQLPEPVRAWRVGPSGLASCARRKGAIVWNLRPLSTEPSARGFHQGSEQWRSVALASIQAGDPMRYTLTMRLPRFSPASNPISAAGAFSRPSITSSSIFNLPALTHELRSAIALSRSPK